MVVGFVADAGGGHWEWDGGSRVIYNSSVHVCVLSRFNCVLLIVTLQTIVRQAHLSMGFSSREH